MTKNHFEGKLTQEQQNTLKELNDSLNKYISLKDGDEVDLYFDPGSIEQTIDKWQKDRIEFKVHSPAENRDGIFSASVAVARQIMPFLQKGVQFLHIRRIGQLQDTRYYVTEAKA